MAGDDPDLELEPNRDSRRFNSAYLDLESRTFRHSRRLRPSVVVDGASRADRYSRRFNSWQQSDPELAPARHSRRFNSSHLSDTSSIAELVEEVEANPPTEEPRQGDHDQYIKGLPLYALVAGLMMAAFLLMIDSTILVTAIPSITSAFNSLEDIGWYGSTYLLATCALQLLFGKVYEFYNSQLIFIGAFMIFVVGSLICGAATSSRMFIAGRAVAGAGGAGILNGALVIVAAAAPMESRPKLIGIILGVASTGVAIGPLIGGALTQRASWRWCFYLNGPAGAITGVCLALIRIPDARVKPGGKLSITKQIDRLDLPACLLFAGSSVMLLLALDWGGVSYPWGSATIVSLFWAAGFSLCLFLAWEYRRGAADSLLPLGLFRNPIVACASATSIMSYGGLYVIILYLPLWFQAVKGVSPLTSGVDYLPSVVTTTIATVASGFLVSKLGYYAPFMIVGSATASVAAGLMTTFSPHSPVSAWVGFQLLNGIARGMMSQQPITAIQANLSKEQLSVGTALVVFCQNFGAAVFISLGQTVFENGLLPALRDLAPELDARQVVGLGATNFRSVVPEDSVPHVVAAYNRALTRNFYLSVGTSCAAFILAWGLGWENLKHKDDEELQGQLQAGMPQHVKRRSARHAVRDSMAGSVMSM
ncbi:MAG: hypothetical protein LQ349_003444 [Xanthoria aureola]|nr:MAG: hypothetical protein LQ349_003444 [Xanthoria aureola]